MMLVRVVILHITADPSHFEQCANVHYLSILVLEFVGHSVFLFLVLGFCFCFFWTIVNSLARNKWDMSLVNVCVHLSWMYA